MITTLIMNGWYYIRKLYVIFSHVKRRGIHVTILVIVLYLIEIYFCTFCALHFDYASLTAIYVASSSMHVQFMTV